MADRRIEIVSRRAMVTVAGAALVSPLVARKADAAAADPARAPARDQAAAKASKQIIDNARQDVDAIPSGSAIPFSAIGPGSVTRSVEDKLRDTVSVKDFGARGDETGDDAPAIQRAINAVKVAGGGTVFFPAGVYSMGVGAVVPSGVSLLGAGSEASLLQLKTPRPATVTIHTDEVEGYEGGARLPSRVRAGVILQGDAPNGRYKGSIRDLGVVGGLDGSRTNWTLEFGVVSVGSASDVVIDNLHVQYAKYGVLFPDLFVARVSRNRAESCGYAFTVNQGTSLTYQSNFANNCAYRGHYFRNLAYSAVSSAACDHLNYRALYPDRSRHCIAYQFVLCHGVTVQNCGQEHTNGTNWLFDGFDNCLFINNYSSNIGSDYGGPDRIAWMYFTSRRTQQSCFADNAAYFENSDGLTFGAANPARHHNIYFEDPTSVDLVRFERNFVRPDYTEISQAGWLNNSEFPVSARTISGSTPTIYSSLVVWDSETPTRVTDLRLGDPSIREVTIWFRTGTATLANHFLDPSTNRFFLGGIDATGAAHWTAPAGAFVKFYKPEASYSPLWQISTDRPTLRGVRPYHPPSLAPGAAAAPITIGVSGAAPADIVRGITFDAFGLAFRDTHLSAPGEVTTTPYNPTPRRLTLDNGVVTAIVEKG